MNDDRQTGHTHLPLALVVTNVGVQPHAHERHDAVQPWFGAARLPMLLREALVGETGRGQDGAQLVLGLGRDAHRGLLQALPLAEAGLRLLPFLVLALPQLGR